MGLSRIKGFPFEDFLVVSFFSSSIFLFFIFSFFILTILLAPAPISPKIAPTSTVLPFPMLILLKIPEAGEGTSTFTLSVSNSTKGSSVLTSSPSFFNHFATVASVIDSPRVGTKILSLIKNINL